MRRLFYSLTVCCLFTIPIVVVADGDHRILGTVTETYSAASKGGWRRIESLRLQGASIEKAKITSIDKASSELEVTLQKEMPLSMYGQRDTSALFRRIIVETGKKPQLRILLRETRSPRTCLSDTSVGVLYLVCTEEFHSQSAMHIAPVVVQDNVRKKVQPSVTFKSKHSEEPVGKGTSPTGVSKNPFFEVAEDGEEEQSVVTPLVLSKKLPRKSSQKSTVLEKKQRDVTVIDTEGAARRKILMRGKVPAALRAIEFVQDGSNRLLRLPLSSESDFSLIRIGERKYHLRLPDCHLEHAGLENPFFAPMRIDGISFVQVERDADGILLKIAVDEKTRLNAIKEGSDLLLERRI